MFSYGGGWAGGDRVFLLVSYLQKKNLCLSDEEMQKAACPLGSAKGSPPAVPLGPSAGHEVRF